jgi:predicted transcriptional regulator of viral defense system
MEFRRLLEIVGDEPVFETGLLLAGDVAAADVHRQLSRWTRAGQIYQLRRGVYTLAPPHQKVRPHPFVLANALAHGSYVSLQSALAHYGLIPEVAPAVTSVTTARPGRWETPLGDFEFRRIQADWLRGYRRLVLDGRQSAFVATPEKALLDLIYLHAGGDAPAYLQELRLQSLDRLDRDLLLRLAEESGRPKLRRAAGRLADLARAAQSEYQTL